jgi:hypothetical protein
MRLIGLGGIEEMRGTILVPLCFEPQMNTDKNYSSQIHTDVK